MTPACVALRQCFSLLFDVVVAYQAATDFFFRNDISPKNVMR